MLLSQAYQLSSTPDPDALKADPENRLVHYLPPRRLEAEAVRDAILDVAGVLDTTMYGPPVPPFITPTMATLTIAPPSGPTDGAGRRSIYQDVKRNFMSPFLMTFDFPTPFASCGRRIPTSVPSQSLALLNNPFVVSSAAKWGRALAESSAAPRERITQMYATALSRAPTQNELAAAVAFLEGDDLTTHPAQAWSDLAQVIFELNEFIVIK
jgi:hypothetical protein